MIKKKTELEQQNYIKMLYQLNKSLLDNKNRLSPKVMATQKLKLLLTIQLFDKNNKKKLTDSVRVVSCQTAHLLILAKNYQIEKSANELPEYDKKALLAQQKLCAINSLKISNVAASGLDYILIDPDNYGILDTTPDSIDLVYDDQFSEFAINYQHPEFQTDLEKALEKSEMTGVIEKDLANAKVMEYAKQVMSRGQGIDLDGDGDFDKKDMDIAREHGIATASAKNMSQKDISKLQKEHEKEHEIDDFDGMF